MEVRTITKCSDGVVMITIHFFTACSSWYQTFFTLIIPYLLLCTSAKLRLKKWSSLFLILPRAIEHSYSGSICMTQNMESAHPAWSSFVPRLLGLAYGPAQLQSKSLVNPSLNTKLKFQSAILCIKDYCNTSPREHK